MNPERPRILYVDIETSPALAAVWGTGKQYVAPNQLRRRTRVQCVAWKWRGQRRVTFAAEWDEGGSSEMIATIHAVLDEADLVVHYNGESFDIPHLNREFIEIGLAPPSPYAQVDLYRAVKRRFRFDSHRLGSVLEYLDLGRKRHEDMTLWNALDEGSQRARAEMARYNAQDVRVLEELYDKILPWIDGHPNVGVFQGDDRPCCPACGSARMERRGLYRTATGVFQRYCCQVCGKWARSARRESTTALRSAS